MSVGAQQNERVKMSKLFRIAHGLVKNNLPIAQQQFQRDLYEALSDSKDLGQTYSNEKAVAEFVTHIGETAYEEFAQRVLSSKFISLTGDESTDKAVKENSAWCVKTCSKGVVTEGLMGLVELPKADAQGIF